MLVTRLKLPPFIVTLGTLSIFTASACSTPVARASRRSDMPDLLNWTGHDVRDRPVPASPPACHRGHLLAVVVAFVLGQTAWGRHVYAVGDDIEAARLAGIRVNRVLLSVYTVAGLIYGITAWILIGRAGTASPNAIVDANLETHHRRRDRRHQPVRWPRRDRRHHPRCADRRRLPQRPVAWPGWTTSGGCWPSAS